MNKTHYLPFIPIVFFLGMILVSGYLMVSGQVNDEGEIAEEKVEAYTQIFRHPGYGYSLNLPAWIKDKYSVRERDGESLFYYQSKTGQNLPLFGIRRYSQADWRQQEKLFSTRVIKLGVVDDQVFSLFNYIDTAEVGSIEKDSLEKLSGEMPAIAQTFKASEKNINLTVEDYFSKRLKTSPDNLFFSAYENLSTEEGATTTVYYIWLYTEEYDWEGDSLDKVIITSVPAKVLIIKNNNGEQTVGSHLIPKTLAEIKKNFPSALWQSIDMKATGGEFNPVVKRLKTKVAEDTIDYFGVAPVIVKKVYVKKLEKDGSARILVVSQATSTSKVGKTIPLSRYSVAQDYQISTPDGQGLVSLDSFEKIFLPSSTSTLKNILWEINLSGNEIVEIKPSI